MSPTTRKHDKQKVCYRVTHLDTFPASLTLRRTVPPDITLGEGYRAQAEGPEGEIQPKMGQFLQDGPGHSHSKLLTPITGFGKLSVPGAVGGGSGASTLAVGSPTTQASLTLVL